MANAITTLPLNKGLDLVTPPLQIEQGSLIDCLNYELTDIAGYRRIDGYERYDGFPNGAVYEFYRIEIIADNPANQPLIVPGSVISRVGDSAPIVDIGFVLGGPYSSTFYDVTPNADITQFVLSEASLLLSDGSSSLLLSDGSTFLGLAGGGETLGSTFVVTTPSGTSFVVSVGVSISEGRTLFDAATYVTTLRSYSETLRSLVEEAPGEIVGLHWFDDRLLAAVNTLKITVTLAGIVGPPVTGIQLRWNGAVYRLVSTKLVSQTTDSVYTLFLYPISTSGTVNDNLVHVDALGAVVSTIATSISSQSPETKNSDYAVIGYFNNPNVSSGRGFTYLTPAYEGTFNTGTYAASALGPPLTLDTSSSPSNVYWVVGSGGTVVFKVRLMSAVKSSGDWVAGTAVGTMSVVLVERIAGTRDYPVSGDVVHSVYPTTGSSAVATFNGTPTVATLPGSAVLDMAQTRYQWDTYNFYGQSASLTAYGTTGAGRAFWADENGFGSIIAISDATLDKPKYLAYHVGKLALGYEHGSVMLSVVGEPTNFQGVAGALEIATGDDITGLLELPGDTLAVFGRRSIRALRGHAEDDSKLETISAKAGCYDYSAVLVGQQAVFAGINGITTLEQTSAYGDFVSKDLTYKISTWLRPKLPATKPGFEKGGIVCAYPVRSKSQYRLLMQSGEFVILTFTEEGPKLTFANHALSGDLRIPYAVSSGVSKYGLERIHMAWTTDTLRKFAYEIDTGWGFDGRSFSSYFEVAHVFNDTGATYLSVEKVRLYGQGYGLASLYVNAAGIEDDFNQEYPTSRQDISMPRNIETLYDRMRPVTAIVDHRNWGLGVKIRIGTSVNENTTETEPSHICQVILAHVNSQGANDT